MKVCTSPYLWAPTRNFTGSCLPRDGQYPPSSLTGTQKPSSQLCHQPDFHLSPMTFPLLTSYLLSVIVPQSQIYHIWPTLYDSSGRILTSFHHLLRSMEATHVVLRAYYFLLSVSLTISFIAMTITDPIIFSLSKGPSCLSMRFGFLCYTNKTGHLHRGYSSTSVHSSLCGHNIASQGFVAIVTLDYCMV